MRQYHDYLPSDPATTAGGQVWCVWDPDGRNRYFNGPKPPERTLLLQQVSLVLRFASHSHTGTPPAVLPAVLLFAG
jgi:hypothetical protein